MENDKRRNTIIAIIAGIALVVILIIAWIIKSVNDRNETGGPNMTKDGVVITTDVSSIVEYGFPEKFYKDFSENFYSAMTVINPTCNKQAKAKNIEVSNDTYTFTIVRCNENYDVELVSTGKNYEFSIKKGDETLINYNSGDKDKTYLSADSISKFLPMNLTAEDGQKFTISQKNKSNPQELEIGTSSCGNQDKKNKAIEAAKDALEYTGFNPEDFTYTAPNYCDKE